MRYLKLYEQFRLILENKDYNVKWIAPTEEYFRQELSELLGNTMRYSKEEFFHPNNIEFVYQVMPYTLTKIAEIIEGNKISDKADVLKVLTNLEEIDGVITEQIENDTKCKDEGIRFFKLGKLLPWDVDKVNKTWYMGKMSSFSWNKIEDIQDPQELLSQVSKNQNLSGFKRNIETFLSNGIKELPAPFVVKLPSARKISLDNKPENNEYNLLGGHKRSAVALQLGIPVSVWLIDLTKV